VWGACTVCDGEILCMFVHVKGTIHYVLTKMLQEFLSHKARRLPLKFSSFSGSSCKKTEAAAIDS
jgi:hypothetical protein